MDDRSFDRLARLLGEARDRRTGLKALVGGILGAGGLAALDMDADAKRTGRKDASPRAGKKKKRKKCDPACEAGFDCVKGRCTCASGVSCDGACCGAGQACRNGACAEPLPACLEFGAECKGVGRACCGGLTCASGQDGSFPVTCLKSKGAACAGTAECPFGMSCTEGVCARNGGPAVPTGAACSAGANCEQPGATCSAYTTPGAPGGTFCTLPLRKVCTGNPDCTCYNCWYVNDGAVIGGRQGRAAAPVKACVQPKNAQCTVKTDCALGLDCVGGVCTGTAQCAPAGGDCSGGATCCTGTCTNGVCPGGGGRTCTVNRSDYGDDAQGKQDAYTALKNALIAAQDDPGNSAKNPVYVGPGTWPFPGEGGWPLQLETTSTTVPLKIFACDPDDRPIFDGGQPWVNHVNDTTRVPDGTEWTAMGPYSGYGILELGYAEDTGDCGENDGTDCAGFEIDGIDFHNASNTRRGSYPGAIYASTLNLKVSNSDIIRCKGASGGINAIGPTTLKNVTVRQCFANEDAGGITYDGEDPTTVWEDVNIQYNGAVLSGVGGLILGSETEVALKTSTISNNAPGGVQGSYLTELTCDSAISGNTPVQCAEFKYDSAPTFGSTCGCNAACVLQGRICNVDGDCCTGAGTCKSTTNSKVCCVGIVCGNICCSATSGTCGGANSDQCP